MDVGAISIGMSQYKVKQDASIAVMKIALDTGKDNATQTTQMMSNVAIDPNVGQIFNAIA